MAVGEELVEDVGEGVGAAFADDPVVAFGFLPGEQVDQGEHGDGAVGR